MWPWYMSSCKYVIVGWRRVIWEHTAFIPAIHYHFPCIPLAIPWFWLQPALVFSKLDNFMSPLLRTIINLVILGIASWLTIEIYPLPALVNYESSTLFPLPHALPHLHDLSRNFLLSNWWPRLIFPLWASGDSKSLLLLLPQYFHPKSTICRHASLIDWRLWFTLALRASGVFNSCTLSLSLGVFSPKFDDL